MAHRKPEPFVPRDQEAFGRLPLLVQQAMQDHQFDGQRMLSAIEQAVQGFSKERIAAIQLNVLRAAGYAVSEKEEGEND